MLDKLQSLWIGSKLSKMEQLSIQSFLDHGHEYILYTYGNIEGVQNGPQIMDANQILCRDEVSKLFSDLGSHAIFADLFRYKLLYDKGGIWVDTDIVCLKPFNFKREYLICSEYNQSETKYGYKNILRVNNCVIKTPKRSKVMEYCYQQTIMKDPNYIKWGETGPWLIHEAYLNLTY